MRLEIFVSTSMEAEEYIKQCVDGASDFNREFALRFPDFKCTAGIRNLVGNSAALTVDFINAKDRSEAPRGMVENMPGFITFMMHLTDGSGKHVPMEKFSIELMRGPSKTIVKDYGIKPYRKITANSPKQALKKLLDWFDQNSFQLKKLPKSYNEL